MPEWTSVLVVFWALWALDGVRVWPHAVFTITAALGTRARTRFARLSTPSVMPTRWRMTAVDAPLTFSPAGICNRIAGVAGRPADGPAEVVAWRWNEVREIGTARGWIFVNGRAFCRDTRHVDAADLLALAQLPPAAREERLRRIIARWFTPLRLRRKARVIEARTRTVAALNAIALGGWLGLSVYVAADLASRIPPRASAMIADAIPWMTLALIAFHIVAVTLAWGAVRRLRVAGSDKRATALFSALLLPPQGMRLRAVVGDGVFPPQHPLSAVVAFGDRREVEQYGFNAVADLDWPIGDAKDSVEAREIAKWFRDALRVHLETMLQQAGIAVRTLLEPPPPDAPTSCTYCPRCGDQFVAGRETCANGVPLRPLRGRKETATPPP